MASVNFTIKNSCFFNNGDLLLPLLKDKGGIALETAITNWLCQNYTLVTKQHKSKASGSWSGYNATDINKKLRNKMKNVKGMHAETHVEYRGLFHSSKEGFDFSIYDEECNYIRLRNTCIGYPGMFNGNDILEDLYKKLRSSKDDKIKMKKKDWENILAKIGGTPGENVIEKKQCFTVVGEIQFGNWALAKHDLFRLMNSSAENAIDYYIYIAPTGTLAEKVSDGVVTYDKIVKAIQENIQRISTPMWIIGLDV